ncbi:DUF2156 domain-containing protein [Thermospira aquatica]|uniref:DUF2156 domain-containing protein n=1 Tax=Thermospira aquatica TaxID=2828656 RepID=A0AAX3BDK5_9SPIR|nr:phosphatidylglycerol lysyltransferase domain-containing protein [Thermospira aquatica]URA10134.1 DUF2156 domain-containing protein [Thermospira aquatica]
MSWSSFTKEDKILFDRWFRQMQPKISEFTFTNLFIWQKAQNIRWQPYKEGALLIREENGETVLLPPVGFQDCEQIFKEVIEIAHSENIMAIVRIPEWAKRFLPHHGVLHPQREHFDYIYKASQLAELKGWRLDGKRAFVRKFIQNYPNWKFIPFTANYLEGCKKLLDHWLAEKQEIPGVREEYEATLLLLDCARDFHLEGGVLLVEDKVVAFSFGEKLNETTFVTHCEKADTSYIGVYQMINQQMAQHIIAPSYLFVNREQDLGLEGLRKAKKSYAPLKMIKKYRYEIP